MDFIIANFEAIAGLIGIIVLAVYAIVTRQWGLLKVAAYQLMLTAERDMAFKAGRIKFNAVFAELWQKAPGWIKRIYNEEQMKQILQGWYNAARDSLK